VGQALQRKFGRSQAEAGGAPVAAQAVEVLLAAIARSDGSRSSVTSHVLGDPVRGGILGNFAFDRNGDMVPGPVAVYRLQHGRQALDRVLRVSSRLLR
jgi:ABC-type branched-subunit amino acid transport system substrate-binding protein